MNKKSTRKLVLAKETLRSLTQDGLKQVAGGLVPSNGPWDYSCRCTTGDPDASCVMQCMSYGGPC
jgi:hypothetical protein